MAAAPLQLGLTLQFPRPQPLPVAPGSEAEGQLPFITVCTLLFFSETEKFFLYNAIMFLTNTLYVSFTKATCKPPIWFLQTLETVIHGLYYLATLPGFQQGNI